MFSLPYNIKIMCKKEKESLIYAKLKTFHSEKHKINNLLSITPVSIDCSIVSVFDIYTDKLAIEEFYMYKNKLMKHLDKSKSFPIIESILITCE